MIPRSSDPELRHPPLPALHATESLSSASGRSGGAVNPRIMSAFGADLPLRGRSTNAEDCLLAVIRAAGGLYVQNAGFD